MLRGDFDSAFFHARVVFVWRWHAPVWVESGGVGVGVELSVGLLVFTYHCLRWMLRCGYSAVRCCVCWMKGVAGCVSRFALSGW